MRFLIFDAETIGTDQQIRALNVSSKMDEQYGHSVTVVDVPALPEIHFNFQKICISLGVTNRQITNTKKINSDNKYY